MIRNNTIIRPLNNVARILSGINRPCFVPGRYGYFINYIIMFNQSDLGSYVGVGPSTAPDTFTFGHNLWYALDNPGFSGPSYYEGIPPEGNSVIQQDPQLDLDGGDYHIFLTGPAAGNGRIIPGGEMFPYIDYEGNFHNYTPDIGAYRAM